MNRRQLFKPDAGSEDASVTRWLTDLRRGDESAADRLWGHLHRRLLRLARREVARQAPTEFDEEDVALSAFHTFCQSIMDGRYGDVANRDTLWQLLLVVTINKARRRIRDHNRLCRGGGFTRNDFSSGLMETFASPEPDPEMVSMAREECQRLLSSLTAPDLQLVVLLKVEGYTNDQVAGSLGCTRRSVQRKLELIRDLWAEEIK